LFWQCGIFCFPFNYSYNFEDFSTGVPRASLAFQQLFVKCFFQGSKMRHHVWMCIMCIQFVHVSIISRLDFGTVLIMSYIFVFHFIYLEYIHHAFAVFKAKLYNMDLIICTIWHHFYRFLFCVTLVALQ
jgi:hypothetical protein